ncbi:signal peptidase I [Vitiosangium sp. GDMCC 1.1324]|uniref:signal peptidase I n=1 Tax=Vitiosangium sp. (strain GDMCC 1.1324) TaxID=2138576 RepID=UPI000D381BF7|nr:signal peptidase I [Vitiosangium sp. GDMCC 1.1324]PTL80668.1 signal peptidase I [Vitiosangium sp. GDMCC 1.1324]
MSPHSAMKQNRPGWKKYLIELTALGVLFVGRASFADHYHVPSGSMEPTLRVMDHLAVDKRAYGLRVPLTHVWLTESEPRRGDVVVFDSPIDGKVMVKRLVGLPGDHIAFEDGVLRINGQPVAQVLTQDGSRLELLPGALHPLHPEPYQGPGMDEQEVPPRHYVVMGDHRGNSADSRVWGLLPRENLLGRVVAVLYSPREGLSGGEHWWIPMSTEDGAGVDTRLTR